MSRARTVRPVLIAAVSLVALGAAGVVVTATLGTSTSTTSLDAPGGAEAAQSVPADIVAGRIISRYHPLPWVGSRLDDVRCPAPLEAVAGTTLTCTGTVGAESVEIPVRVETVSSTSVTWSFGR